MAWRENSEAWSQNLVIYTPLFYTFNGMFHEWLGPTWSILLLMFLSWDEFGEEREYIKVISPLIFPIRANCDGSAPFFSVPKKERTFNSRQSFLSSGSLTLYDRAWKSCSLPTCLKFSESVLPCTQKLLSWQDRFVGNSASMSTVTDLLRRSRASSRKEFLNS